jgi:hypothetical protein
MKDHELRPVWNALVFSAVIGSKASWISLLWQRLITKCIIWQHRPLMVSPPPFSGGHSCTVCSTLVGLKTNFER